MNMEQAKKIAGEKAENAAKHEAWMAHFVASVPLTIIAIWMAVNHVPTIFYTLVVLMGLFGGWIMYSSIKPGAYKKYYEKYLEEFALLGSALAEKGNASTENAQSM
jgi:hypothetical protein